MKSRFSAASSAIRKVLLGVWLVALAAGVGSYIVAPETFTASNIAAFLDRFQGMIWGVYLGVSILRGLTLLPSTPLVIAGTLLFPGQKVAVLVISLIGIGLSSTMIFFFSELLGFNAYFENRRPELTHKIKRRLEHPLGLLFVAAWAFFPLVPTDLVCYVAGTTGMNYWKFIAAVLAGETVLCIVYIFFGGSIVNMLR